MRKMACSWLAVFLIAALFAGPAMAHDLSDPDGAWYQGLRVPMDAGGPYAGNSCCDGPNGQHPDCKNVEIRTKDGQLQAFIDSKTFPDVSDNSRYGHAPNDWVPVPEKNILYRHDNPTGAPVACWYNGSILCFIEGPKV